jgi:uncharacterized protein (DUF305 family)
MCSPYPRIEAQIMFTTERFAITLAGLLLLGVAANADEALHHTGHNDPSRFNQMMAEAMMRMDGGMSIRHTGDPDVDFSAMMIPHHQGAIDMAKAELQFGRNPVLRRLAEGIIVEQQQEIDLMRRELQRRQSGSTSSRR